MGRGSPKDGCGQETEGPWLGSLLCGQRPVPLPTELLVPGGVAAGAGDSQAWLCEPHPRAWGGRGAGGGLCGPAGRRAPAGRASPPGGLCAGRALLLVRAHVTVQSGGRGARVGGVESTCDVWRVRAALSRLLLAREPGTGNTRALFSMTTCPPAATSRLRLRRPLCRTGWLLGDHTFLPTSPASCSPHESSEGLQQ